MLGVLSTLCAVGILYHNKEVLYEILSKKNANITATLMLQEHEANETERQYEAQKVKYQQVQKELSECKVTEKLLKMKYHQVHEQIISACKENQSYKLCEKGWKSLGLKCYYFSTSKLNWTQSRDDCVKKGGHLVIISSRAEQDCLSSQLQITHWIGLNDLETEGKWMWVNNQSLNETGVTFWFRSPKGQNEPDNWTVQDPSGENCASLGNGNGNIHTWFDASCKTLKKYICER
ncbi:C-type lectin domain family 6 member A-like isoform X2 [Silurus meridionalis]|uniref:C-type lectin domain family 6 member A-like isoform X2 n=1 Tax=Silurus meridionalis TaxID=175797 RepID=UPI001EECD057|nr:C-type lectin domain family 6 member A-like isoform X2 [Silurus meridionalis]